MASSPKAHRGFAFSCKSTTSIRQDHPELRLSNSGRAFRRKTHHMTPVPLGWWTYKNKSTATYQNKNQITSQRQTSNNESPEWRRSSTNTSERWSSEMSYSKNTTGNWGTGGAPIMEDPSANGGSGDINVIENVRSELRENAKRLMRIYRFYWFNILGDPNVQTFHKTAEWTWH